MSTRSQPDSKGHQPAATAEEVSGGLEWSGPHFTFLKYTRRSSAQPQWTFCCNLRGQRVGWADLWVDSTLLIAPFLWALQARGQVKDKQQDDVMFIRKQDGGRVRGSRARRMEVLGSGSGGRLNQSRRSLRRLRRLADWLSSPPPSVSVTGFPSRWSGRKSVLNFMCLLCYQCVSFCWTCAGCARRHHMPLFCFPTRQSRGLGAILVSNISNISDWTVQARSEREPDSRRTHTCSSTVLQRAEFYKPSAHIRDCERVQQERSSFKGPIFSVAVSFNLNCDCSWSVKSMLLKNK